LNGIRKKSISFGCDARRRFKTAAQDADCGARRGNPGVRVAGGERAVNGDVGRRGRVEADEAPLS
jgi:hypothetical protein